MFRRIQDAADATMEVAKTLNEKISKYCLVTVETCAYAGTGNVLKVDYVPFPFPFCCDGNDDFFLLTRKCIF